MAFATSATDDTETRRKLANALLLKGMDTSPVQAWTQGAARVANAIIGGYMGAQLDKEEKAGDAQLQNLPGLGMAAPSAQSAPAGAVDSNTPRGIRNNNPGNIEDGPFAQKMPGYAGSDGRFAKFQTPEHGTTAMDSLLASYGARGINNVSGVINRWAPPSDNNPTNTYAATVAKGMNVDPNAPIDLNDPNVRRQLAGGIAQFENGRPAPGGAAPQPPVNNGAIGNSVIGQTGGIPQRSSVAIPPDVAVSIRNMLANPRTQQMGLALYSQYAKPSDQYAPVRDARGNVVGQRSQLTGEIKTVPQDPEPLRVVQEMYARPQAYGFTGPNDPALQEAARHKLSGQSNSVSVNTVANPVLEGVGKQIVQSRASAQAAAQLIPQIHDARRVLEEGMTTGAFADPRIFAQKVGALFGMDAKDAANAETFRAIIGNQVLAHIKTLGTNPSNTDRDYIEKIMGGQIALEPSSLRRVMDINEKYARQAIKQFNGDSKKLMDADPNAYRGIAPLMQIDEPGNYTPAATAQPTPQQIQDELNRRGLR